MGRIVLPGQDLRSKGGVILQPPVVAAWSPLNLGADLWGWYKDSGLAGADTDPLAQWDDASGSSHHLLQATGANQPIKKTNILNGLPVARLDGSNDFMGAAGLATQPVHLFVVCRFNGAFDGSHRAVLDSNSDAYGHLLYRASSTGIGLYAGSAPLAATTTPENFHYYAAYFAGVSSSLSIDGGAPAVVDAGTGGSATGLRIGASGGGGGDWAGIDFAEVVACSAQITGANLTNLLAYLAARFAL